AVVVNDAYNANPTSMRAALEALAAMEADRRIAVLGEMAELGPSSAEGHLEVAGEALELGVELVAYRTPAYGVPAAVTEAELVDRLMPLGRGDVVLVKGSRAAGLEAVADALVRALDGTGAGR
ncbi:MAG: glutamate ligase domain-containing protein, partial [Acidimicrobiales bacterium]